MKIAFFTYPSAFQNIGGGEIALLKTKEYLEKAGVKVEFFDMWRSRIEEYDILQVFGSVKDCLGLVEVAKTRGVKVATTPVLWSDWRRAIFNDQPFRAKADYAMRYFTKVLLPAFPSERRKLLVASDILFPNSEMERIQISRHFAIPKSKMTVMYNAVSSDFEKTDAALFRQKYGPQAFILGVGRLEPRKNQLNLIRAVKKAGLGKLILIGSAVSGYESYEKKCRQEGEGFVTFLPTLAHEDPLLKSAYAACSVFVLQGWFETPGLVALEAGLAGAKVVATVGGSTREYFQKHVLYLNPADPEDIARKIKTALEQPKNNTLKTHIQTHFMWEKIAQDYIHAYIKLLTR